MRTVDFFAGVLCPLTILLSSAVQAETSFLCAGPEVEPPRAGVAKALSSHILPTRGKINVLVVFARFKDETPKPVPSFADELFDPRLEGSFAHFYRTMSFDQLEVGGTVLPKRYASDQPKAAYLADRADEVGQFARFALEILRQVDADTDLSAFDNDGPDGLPNSGDDDGMVDYIFILLQSTPDNFLFGGATGIAGLGFEEKYVSDDLSARGGSIHIRGLNSRGSLLREGPFAWTVGLMAHEFGHALGLPDLYDRSYENPAEDSAGIGRWGLMGWGALGWNDGDGPNPFCAWSLEKLGWIGRGNDRLVEVVRDRADVRIADLHRGGAIYKVPLGFKMPIKGIYHQVGTGAIYPYLLLEHRVREAHYYNRNLPAEGLLVWHINPLPSTSNLPLGSRNNLEEDKLVDLVCADGLYADAGFPLGADVDAQRGGDNLDFWAHNKWQEYRETNGGNLGDATDPFDGVKYTRLNLSSNPSIDFGGMLPAATTGVALENLRRQGEFMRADIFLPRWAGIVREEIYWTSAVLVDGDLTIAPEGKLVVRGDARVQFAAADRLQSGRDPERCEIHIQGELRVEPAPVYRDLGDQERERAGFKTIVFEAQEPGPTWYGIYADASAQVHMPEGGFALSGAEYGFLAPGSGFPAEQPDHPTAVIEDTEMRPASFELLANYPNPFNPETTIRYALPQASHVRLQIFNALGQVVRTLEDGFHSAGAQAVGWDGRDDGGKEMSSGVYFYQLEVAGQGKIARQMVLVR